MDAGKNANYWPGFVDALTNVVIAMVFVIVVLAVSLSFSAQLMAKRMAARIPALEEPGRGLKPAPPQAPDAPRPPDPALTEPNPPSRLAIDRRVQVKGNDTAASAAPARARPRDGALVLEFAASALTLDEAALAALAPALADLRQRLASAPPGTRVMLVAGGPEMELSDNQRAGYIRAMATRNALLAQGIAAAQITLGFDLESKAATPTVSVRLQGPTP